MNRGYLFKKVKVFSGNEEEVLQRAKGSGPSRRNELRYSRTRQEPGCLLSNWPATIRRVGSGRRILGVWTIVRSDRPKRRARGLRMGLIGALAQVKSLVVEKADSNFIIPMCSFCNASFLC